MAECWKNSDIYCILFFIHILPMPPVIPMLINLRFSLNRLIDKNCTGFAVGVFGGIFTNPQIP